MGLGVIDPVAKPPNEYILMNTITCAVFKLYLKYWLLLVLDQTTECKMFEIITIILLAFTPGSSHVYVTLHIKGSANIDFPSKFPPLFAPPHRWFLE